jgi:hypothetical protein
MGIENIHILVTPDVEEQYRIDPVLQAQAAQEQLLVNAHRRGEHPYGRMIRACPLCQQDR